MTIPHCDYHIHTTYLGCANETMSVEAIFRECERAGVESIAITDHLNRFEQADKHLGIRDDIERIDTPLEVFFGVELNFTGYREGFAFNEEVRERIGFQFAIGGIHRPYLDEYDLDRLIAIQHEHHLLTCANPAVDVLVHPYWFGWKWFRDTGFPWFDSVKVVPESLTRELGQAARESGTAIEINADANLVNPRNPPGYVDEYVDYMAILADEGVMFSLSSDAHDVGQLKNVRRSWEVAERLGLTADRIWRPDCEPMRKGR